MSSDEALTRLQNALTTLAEVAARSQEVDAQHEARLNSLEESNRRIAETNRRIAETNRDLAESNRLIVEMIRRHDERVDEFRAARDETDQKLAALVDAQIRAEDEMNKVREALAELAQTMTSLTKKVDVIRGSGGQSSG